MRAGMMGLCLVALTWSGAALGADGLVVKSVIHAEGQPVVSGGVIAVAGDNGFAGGGMTTVWEADGAGNWNLAAKLLHGGPAALSNGTLVLADRSTQVFTTNPVRVYGKDASGTWYEQTTLTGNNVDVCDFFGSSVGVDGDWAVVGAFNYGGGPPNPWCHPSTGGVFIFKRDAAGTWTQTQVIAPAPLGGGATINNFGWNLVLGHGKLFVAANEELPMVNNAEPSRGLVYVYTPDASGQWQFTNKVPGESIFMGFAATDDWLVTGSPSKPDAVAVYTPATTGGWQVDQTLTADPGATGIYGVGTAVSGSLLAVTAGPDSQVCPASGCGSPSPPAPGRLYAYGLAAGQWQPMGIYASPEVKSLLMEDAVITDGRTVVADGIMTDTDGQKQAGFVVMQSGSVPMGYAPVTTDGGYTTTSSSGEFGWLPALLLFALVGLRRC